MNINNVEPAKQSVVAHYQPKITIDSSSLSTLYRIHAYGIVVLPIIGLITAVLLALNFGISPIDFSLFLILWLLSGLGIEVGFHRYLSHRSFQTSTPIRVLLAIFGSMAGQGPPIYWVANHRRHHQYSDVIGDTHSPHLHGQGFWGRIQGLWYAHFGWIFDLELTNTYLFAKDLLRDGAIAKVNQYYYVWVFLGLALPAVVGGILTGSIIGLFTGFLWGGLVRMFVVHQTTYAVNSICHLYGNRPFKSLDQSTNNFWLAIPTLGGSWHNNHHAFPDSAINGLKWWQVDLSGWLLKAMKTLGLIWDVKTISLERIEAKKTA
ncbi:acyl-CoA desaturase [Aphanothece hegewaldii CCALA 016]|uniref:Acyl-CoA desaturase n=1 Tax=Aphanothece hegewaldii CCALA 016 TaxID=2107694 RepID=A0A2T1LYW6_9CHRO|nr:acyl-CoA desaturase [Aphanothece hegewaldii]PSF37561.1 acyl-CoA desaturase [Aphanothece hegewaldii CCALA 016]